MHQLIQYDQRHKTFEGTIEITKKRKRQFNRKVSTKQNPIKNEPVLLTTTMRRMNYEERLKRESRWTQDSSRKLKQMFLRKNKNL